MEPGQITALWWAKKAQWADRDRWTVDDKSLKKFQTL